MDTSIMFHLVLNLPFVKCSCLFSPQFGVVSSPMPKHTTASYTIKILLNLMCSYRCNETLEG